MSVDFIAGAIVFLLWFIVLNFEVVIVKVVKVSPCPTSLQVAIDGADKIILQPVIFELEFPKWDDDTDVDGNHSSFHLIFQEILQTLVVKEMKQSGREMGVLIIERMFVISGYLKTEKEESDWNRIINYGIFTTPAHV